MLRNKLLAASLLLFAVPLCAMEKEKDKDTSEKIAIISAHDWVKIMCAMKQCQAYNKQGKLNDIMKSFSKYNLINSFVDVMSDCKKHGMSTMSFLECSKKIFLNPSGITKSVWQIMLDSYQMLALSTGKVCPGKMGGFFDKLYSEYSETDKFRELLDQTSEADIQVAKKKADDEAARQGDGNSRRVVQGLQVIAKYKQVREEEKKAAQKRKESAKLQRAAANPQKITRTIEEPLERDPYSLEDWITVFDGAEQHFDEITQSNDKVQIEHLYQTYYQIFSAFNHRNYRGQNRRKAYSKLIQLSKIRKQIGQ